MLYPSGNKSHQFGSYGDHPDQFDHPYFVTVTQENCIVVSDSGNMCVKLFDFSGQLLNNFDVNDFKIFSEHFVMLHGVTVDPDGNVLIVANSTVYIVANNGRLWEVLLPEDGVHSPKCLAYSHMGQLVVTQCGMDVKHEVSVFQYDKGDFKSLRSVPKPPSQRKKSKRVSWDKTKQPSIQIISPSSNEESGDDVRSPES